jgi:thioredoxin reductase
VTDSVALWSLAAFVSLGIVVPYTAFFYRRRRADRQRLGEARGLGFDRPAAQFPYIDSLRCIGCGTCVRACPEDVLGIVGGTAVVIQGIRCVGHARCEEVCPVGAIEVGLGDIKGRNDLPVLGPHQESSVPGIFIAGELSGMALISRAVSQGALVVEGVARRLASTPRPANGVAGEFDLVVVGAGPAGISTALAAKSHGLSCVVLDQAAQLGGTILHFPRRKLVLTQPVNLPLGGRLDREEYSKEELLEIFQGLLRSNALDVRFGERVADVVRTSVGFEVRAAQPYQARQVVLALGRRGSPRKLGVAGEEHSKVMYQLRDAESYRGQRILVVGGGDSAVEAAIGLARQPGNQVTVSYRKEAFLRIKKKNLEASEGLIRRGKLLPLFGSQVMKIQPHEVELETPAGPMTLQNDAVFVMIGGDPPFPFLRQIGVRFGGDDSHPSTCHTPPDLAARSVAAKAP